MPNLELPRRKVNDVRTIKALKINTAKLIANGAKQCVEKIN